MYLTWKQDSIPSAVVMRELQGDGIHFVEDSRIKVLLVSTLLWDLEVVEGPWILYREPFYFLFFSANTYQSPQYHVGVARSTSPTGPYQRNSSQNVIQLDLERYIRNNVTFVSPGHCSVVEFSVGNFWLVYHAWHYKEIDENPPGRMLLIDRIQWSEEEWPTVGFPSDRLMPTPAEYKHIYDTELYPEITLIN